MVPKVSVIIPAYNAEKYIGNCLDSLLCQDFKDFEVLIINDGSKDDTEHICSLYCAKDSRIRFFNKPNGGVSSARNLGIAKAAGEWLYFCDADDEVTHDGLSHLISLTDEGIDVAMSAYFTVDGDSVYAPAMAAPKILTPLQAQLLLFDSDDGLYHGYLWTKLFRRSVIFGILLGFDCSINYNEDRLFIMQFLSIAKGNVAYDSYPVYRYFVRGKSAMQSVNGPSFYKFETDLDAFLIMYRLAESSDSEHLKDLIAYGAFKSYKSNVSLQQKYGSGNNDDFIRLKNKLCRYIPLSRIRKSQRRYYRELMILLPSLLVSKIKRLWK